MDSPKAGNHSREPSDRVARVRAGETAALAEAFGTYRLRLLTTIRFRLDARLAGRLDPEDVLQEAFLSASQRHSHVEGNGELALFLWLRLIVLQTLADVHRRHLGAQKRDAGREFGLPAARGGTSTSMSLATHLAASITSPSMALYRLELAERLRDALNQMDETDREILALRHFEELANQEVAEVLGIQQKAASIRYVRALRRLKEIMDGMRRPDETSPHDRCGDVAST